MLPDLGWCNPAMALRSVDLPEPLGPITAVTLPAGMVKDDLLTATTDP